MASSKKAAEEFVKRWTGKGNEEQDKHLYWIGLFQDVLGLTDALDRLKFEQPVHTKASDHQGFIDVLIPTASVIVEQKGIGHDLSKAEVRQGRKVTPAQQALAYTEGLPLSQKPRYVIASNFAEMWVYDTERDPLCKGEPLIIKLADLPKNLPAIQFLAGKGQAPETIQRAVSVEAGRIMGRIHEAVAKSFEAAGFDRNDETTHHAISAFCCRVMFLMFCEDEAGLIPQNAFRNYVQHFPADYLRNALRDLFEWLDTPDENRDPFASDLLKAFPYMNGGLFSERTVIPTLSEDLRTTIIVEGCQEFDWSEVNPTVFGSIFEGSLSHDQRRAGGMHYTSPENIHKVIDPLFLDDLEAAFAEACAKPFAGGARTKALEDLHERLGSISIFDPACGSGNFLTESYQCLRRLENRVLIELSKDGQISFDIEGTGEDQVKVSLANFHGIEINDFACAVARTALWIAEKQADADTASIVHRVYDALPLTDYGNIRQGNALRMDWNEVVPADKCSFICGNPPFIGHQWRTSSQQDDMAEVFRGVKAAGKLDYVCAWYERAADYTQGHPIKCAFVSTNSICQGESVGVLWNHLANRGIEIDFAHTTFVWDSQADDMAHVHVVIVGFSRNTSKSKRLFSNGVPREVDHINGYLSAAPDVFIANRGKPVNPGVPEMTKGSQPTDGGHLILSGEERAELIAKHPELDEVIRPFVGGREFLNGGDRWCLWFDGADLSRYAFPEIAERLQAVRESRLKSPTASVKRDAATPHLFTQIRQPKSDYLALPVVSSGRRKYLSVGYMSQQIIASDQLRFIPTDSIYVLGLLSSQMHAAWMRVTAGRLKSDYRYAPAVYNSFVFPDATEEQRVAVERAAQEILDARAMYIGKSLAQLYDPD
ncbi:MAG: class I SAM-dependent DNA methyltransferase, partial [Atopobiaceae bacterium]|nr:class I SAM-dependent DNA methyltransferase [Atopobiaceae bacterium]